MENACLACQCLGDFRRCDDGQIFAIGRCSFRPIVAAHDRDPAIDDQRLLVRDPGAGIDPYRHAGSGERANAFLEIAGRTTIGNGTNVDAAGMVEPSKIVAHYDDQLTKRGARALRYRSQTEANKATASQMIPQIPSDNSTITISATPGSHIAL
jgi:hypothetical protein